MIAPGLLGLPGDLVLVRSSDEVVPFYEVVFDAKAHASEDFLIKDPKAEHIVHWFEMLHSILTGVK